MDRTVRSDAALQAPDQKLSRRLTNYAYGNATNGNGTATIQFGPSNSLSVNINNIGQQITDDLATSPEITNKTLFAVWGGSNDILGANSADDIIKSVIAQAINIQRLIDAGATLFVIPNIPPLGSTPLLNGSPKTSIPATAAAVLYNQALAVALSILRDFNLDKHLHLVQVVVFSLFNHVVGPPAKYSLSNVTASAQGNAWSIRTHIFLGRPPSHHKRPQHPRCVCCRRYRRKQVPSRIM